jgi:hypothetical protein
MRASALTLVVVGIFVAAFLAVPGCGGDDPPKEEKHGDSVECGGLVCDEVTLPGTYPPIKACCAANETCGLDGTQFEMYGAHFTDPCQPRDQPGELDPDECEASTPVETDFGMLSFPGCCTLAGRCGYMINTAFNLVQLHLGCVDAEPFLDAGVPPSCTPGAGGGGGAGGASQQ